MTQPTARFPFLAETRLSGLAYPAVRALIMHEAEEHDLTVPENTDTRVSLVTEYGQLTFDAYDGGVSATVGSKSEDNLFILKEGLVDSIAHFAPEIAEQLAWSDAGNRTGFPPNFQLARVVSVEDLGTDFMRVVLQADDLSSYTNSSIHFRFVMPPKGQTEPQWPMVNEKGVTVWPKGENTLHRPVYTARKIDHDTNELTVDVFLHEGGRTTDWINSVEVGSIIGITGPGGGGIPEVDAITIYADETGFPAVARMLEALPESVTGRVVLKSDSGADGGYPFPNHAQLKLEWLQSDGSVSLSDLAIEDRKHTADHMLWFASEKKEVLKVRAFCKEKDINTKSHYIASYWSRA